MYLSCCDAQCLMPTTFLMSFTSILDTFICCNFQFFSTKYESSNEESV